jgi:hypothetical protein
MLQQKKSLVQAVKVVSDRRPGRKIFDSLPCIQQSLNSGGRNLDVRSPLGDIVGSDGSSQDVYTAAKQPMAPGGNVPHPSASDSSVVSHDRTEPFQTKGKWHDHEYSASADLLERDQASVASHDSETLPRGPVDANRKEYCPLVNNLHSATSHGQQSEFDTEHMQSVGSIRSSGVSKAQRDTQKLSSDFFHRNIQWKEQRLRQNAIALEIKRRQEIEGCTFVPQTRNVTQTKRVTSRRAEEFYKKNIEWKLQNDARIEALKSRQARAATTVPPSKSVLLPEQRPNITSSKHRTRIGLSSTDQHHQHRPFRTTINLGTIGADLSDEKHRANFVGHGSYEVESTASVAQGPGEMTAHKNFYQRNIEWAKSRRTRLAKKERELYGSVGQLRVVSDIGQSCARTDHSRTRVIRKADIDSRFRAQISEYYEISSRTFHRFR